MPLKILQLNIFQGKFLDTFINFAKKEKFDILHLQEVTAGKMSQGGTYRYPGEPNEAISNANEKFKGVNCFEEIKKELDLDGIIVKTSGLTGDKESYLGNATLFKKNMELIRSETVWLKEFFEINLDFTDIPNLSRAGIITQFKIGSKELTTVNAHLTWGPNPKDEPYKIEQARKLYEAVKNLTEPLVLTGDFNVSPDTQTAGMFNDFGRNLIKENNIVNTLNPRTHPAKVLFPPGIAVDYVIVSEDIKVKSFEVIDKIDISDHFGLLVSFELN